MQSTASCVTLPFASCNYALRHNQDSLSETGSTKKDITVEICSKCHPFYTGKQKLVDTSGRVDKFNKKYGIK